MLNNADKFAFDALISARNAELSKKDEQKLIIKLDQLEVGIYVHLLDELTQEPNVLAPFMWQPLHALLEPLFWECLTPTPGRQLPSYQ